MPYITPKTNWLSADVPLPSDFNRIEGNIEELQNSKETPSGAQAKADAAESNAVNHTNNHISDAVKHITSTERTTWNAKETTGGAQLKANTAEQNAKNYADSGLSNKVDKVVGKGLSTNDYTTAEKNKLAGLSNYDSTNVDAHMANVSNPHSVTAAQVGLGSVQNYGIATQVEAEGGTSDVKHMTPLKVKQSINSEVTTTGVANKIVKATADGDIAASRYLKVGSNYIRYSNGQLEVSSNLTNWEVVGVPRYSNFNVIYMEDVDSIPPTPAVTLANYTGEGVITKIAITTQAHENDTYIISYSVDGGSDVDINRPASNHNFAAGLLHGSETAYAPADSVDYYMNLYFSSSFEIKVRAATPSNIQNLYSAVMFNHA